MAYNVAGCQCCCKLLLQAAVAVLLLSSSFRFSNCLTKACGTLLVTVLQLFRAPGRFHLLSEIPVAGSRAFTRITGNFLSLKWGTFYIFIMRENIFYYFSLKNIIFCLLLKTDLSISTKYLKPHYMHLPSTFFSN